MEKLIITLAHTGNVPTKEINEHTPTSTGEIVDTIESCVEIGASVAHIHVRDSDGRPTSDRSLFAEVLDEIDRRKIKCITQVSTGARGGANTIDWRGQMLDLNAHMASLATGSSNFATSVNANSPELIEALAKKMKENDIVPEIEAFDLAMISNAVYLQKKGVLEGPLHFNLVMNVPGSIKGTAKNLLFMRDSLPPDATWNVTAIGNSHVELITMAIVLGGHVRTGLEDVIYFEKGVLASNQMLVQRVVDIAKAVGREVATPEEAHAILNLRKPL